MQTRHRAVDDDRDREGGEHEGAQDHAGIGEPGPDDEVEHDHGGGTTAIQIISASWCLVGGPTGVGASWSVAGGGWAFGFWAFGTGLSFTDVREDLDALCHETPHDRRL